MEQLSPVNLNEVSSFVSIIHAGSLSQASRVTGIPKSNLSRHLKQLEERLGVTLVQRTTRRMNLTQAGEEYYKNCAQILSDLREVERSVARKQRSPQGMVRLTAPPEFGWRILPPILYKFQKQYPDISFDVHFSEKIVDLVGEGFDVALRAGKLRDSSLKLKALAGNQRFVLVASQSYLKEKGRPTHPNQLAKHRLIAFSPNRDPIVWNLKGPTGSVRIPVSGSLRTNSLIHAYSLAREGAGIALVPRVIYKEWGLKKEGLQILMPNWHMETAGFSILFPNQKHLPPKIRVFVDYLYESLSQTDWR